MDLTVEKVKILLENNPDILQPNDSINISPGCDKNDGYTSYLYKIAITRNNSKTGSKSEKLLIIKCAPEDEQYRAVLNARLLFLGEIYFYQTILPEFFKLNIGTSVDTVDVPKLPAFITAVTAPLKEVVVLEDVRPFGYHMRDKSLFLDEEHLKLVLREFGKLHVYSLVLKHKQYEKYQCLVQGLKDIHDGRNCHLNDEWNRFYRIALQQVKDLFISENNSDILKRLEYIEDHLEEICESFYEYSGAFGVISHMDCWSNNLLFKYNKNNSLDSIYFLDFQYVWVSSPAADFSYIFYVNSKPEEYCKLDEYLGVYYESAQNYSGLLGVDIEGIYPYSKFMEEIEKYSVYGYLRALIGLPLTMRQGDEIIDVKDVVDKGMDTSKAFGNEWSPKCAEWMRKLTLHMAERNFI